MQPRKVKKNKQNKTTQKKKTVSWGSFLETGLGAPGKYPLLIPPPSQWAWVEVASDVETQLILPLTALLRVHPVIIVARWGTLGRPAGNENTHPVGGGEAVSQKDKSVKVVQKPGVEQDSIQNEYPLYGIREYVPGILAWQALNCRSARHSWAPI